MPGTLGTLEILRSVLLSNTLALTPQHYRSTYVTLGFNHRSSSSCSVADNLCLNLVEGGQGAANEYTVTGASCFACQNVLSMLRLSPC